MYFCISIFVTVAHAASSLKSLNHEIKYKKLNRPTKYSREKIRTHEIVTRKNFGPTKHPRQKISDPQNTHEKKF